LEFEVVRWWWARREEMVGPRDEEVSDAEGCCGEGGSLVLDGERGFVGEVEGLGGEELGEISWRGAGFEGAARVVGDSASGIESGRIGGSSSSRYIGGAWCSVLLEGLLLGLGEGFGLDLLVLSLWCI